MKLSADVSVERVSTPVRSPSEPHQIHAPGRRLCRVRTSAVAWTYSGSLVIAAASTKAIAISLTPAGVRFSARHRNSTDINRLTAKAARISGIAGVAIRISPFSSRVGIARATSRPRCSVRIATPVGGQTMLRGVNSSNRPPPGSASLLHDSGVQALAHQRLESRTSTGQTCCRCSNITRASGGLPSPDWFHAEGRADSRAP